ncbi:MAG: PHP domain-containing protein [Chloroflexi bacterium]|nr:PHP domain-containing protein [Chloroflexota bacterium]HEV8053457.1 PHP domain-containing protein [Candidatus Limnocylindrales bacterium]
MTSRRPNRIDLHTHTTRSDGVLSPLELFAEMRNYGMRVVAITDHDSVEGVRELGAAEVGGDRFGMRLIPGIEMNAVAGDDLGHLWPGEVHILGYGVDIDDERLAAALRAQRAARDARIDETLDRLRQLDAGLADAVVSRLDRRDTSLGRPHLARALIAAGRAADVPDAFDRFLARGRPAYVRRRGLSVRGCLDAIRAAGGIPVLAHSSQAPEQPELIDLLVDWGLGGLEVYYGGYGGSGHGFRADARLRLERFANERGLLATGGSDYHGDAVSYADAQVSTFVPDAVGEALLSALSLPASLP